MNLSHAESAVIQVSAAEFLERVSWGDAVCVPLAGDASTRRYYRLRLGSETAILMDASQNMDSVAPFMAIGQHIQQIGFSAPRIYAADAANGFMLLEDFGDATFACQLQNVPDQERLFTLATDVLIALHRHPRSIPQDLRAYHPAKMLADIELFLEWGAPAISETGKQEFRAAWSELLPAAHHVPTSLLLRDYHVANLMLLPERQGVQQAGLLDFQDAYQGPITYDLVSLLEDARRDVPESIRERMIAHYFTEHPGLDQEAFQTSLAILAAQRHTRVLAIFERLSRRDGKHDYKRLHSPRVQRMLETALSHPKLALVKQWFAEYA